MTAAKPSMWMYEDWHNVVSMYLGIYVPTYRTPGQLTIQRKQYTHLVGTSLQL